jgi:hypothetical protein
VALAPTSGWRYGRGVDNEDEAFIERQRRSIWFYAVVAIAFVAWAAYAAHGLVTDDAQSTILVVSRSVTFLFALVVVAGSMSASLAARDRGLQRAEQAERQLERESDKLRRQAIATLSRATDGRIDG